MEGAPPPPLPPSPDPVSGNAPASSTGEEAVSLKALLASVQVLLEEARGALRGRIELFSLELRRSGSALVQMAVLALLAALLGSVAWLTLMAALTVGLVHLGLPWAGSLLIVVLLNLGAALAALMRARALGSQLGFPASRRQLHFGARAEGPAPVPPAPRQDASDAAP